VNGNVFHVIVWEETASNIGLIIQPMDGPLASRSDAERIAAAFRTRFQAKYSEGQREVRVGILEIAPADPSLGPSAPLTPEKVDNIIQVITYNTHLPGFGRL
jgi:hypothetical protein